MSNSNSAAARKRDLIERVRYPNPIPAPPYPPKLLSIPTPASRLSHPSYSARLARNNALPLVVDAEVGMPLDLSRFPRLWAEQRYTSHGAGSGLTEEQMALDPSTLDPEDAFLLSDLAAPLAGASVPLSGAAAPLLVGANANASATATAANAVGGAKVNDVTWLRRTDYLTEEVSKAKASAKSRHVASETVDSSRPAQLARIESTFVAAHSDLSALRHPTKPNVTAVESYELLPDPDTWATRMSVFRFGDHPDGRNEADADLNIDDETADEASLQSRKRVEMGLLKPYSLERIGWYLPTYFDDDEVAEEEEEEDGQDDGENGGRKRKAQKAAYVEPHARRAAERETMEHFGKKRRLGQPSQLQARGSGEEGHAELNGDASSSDVLSLAHIRDYAAHDVVQNQNQEILVVFVDGDAGDGAGDVAREEDEAEAVASGAKAANDENDDDEGLFGDDEEGKAGDADKPGKSDEAESAKKAGKLPSAVLKERAYRASSSSAAADGEKGEQPRKVAYLHPVHMRAALRVRRKRPNERAPDGWFDVARVGHRALDEREAIERLHYRAEVDDFVEEQLPERIILEEPEEEEGEEEVVDDADADAEGAEDAEADADGHADGAADEDEEEEEEAREKTRKPRRVVDDDDDEDDKMEDASEGIKVKPRKVVDDDDDEEEEEEEERRPKDNKGRSEDDDEDDDDDEDEDEDEDEDGMSVDADEELAALRAEAEGHGEADEAQGEGRGGRSRRSRRSAAAAEDTIADEEEE